MKSQCRILTSPTASLQTEPVDLTTHHLKKAQTTLLNNNHLTVNVNHDEQVKGNFIFHVAQLYKLCENLSHSNNFNFFSNYERFHDFFL